MSIIVRVSLYTNMGVLRVKRLDTVSTLAHAARCEESKESE